VNNQQRKVSDVLLGLVAAAMGVLSCACFVSWDAGTSSGTNAILALIVVYLEAIRRGVSSRR